MVKRCIIYLFSLRGSRDSVNIDIIDVHLRRDVPAVFIQASQAKAKKATSLIIYNSGLEKNTAHINRRLTMKTIDYQFEYIEYN